MNTYNENLHASVVNSLQKLEQDQKKANADANAAMFSLYYAEGATVTSRGKLETAKAEQAIEETVKEKAVRNSNLSINLQASADSSVQYLKQSVSNAAVAASGVQIAANAILKLSSDIGSISNIVNAADYGTEIHSHATDANNLIRDTAYDAELASQLAMETSVATAGISGTAMQGKAKTEGNTMNDLLTALAGNYDAISKTVSADNEALAAESAIEKKAEGTYDDLSILQQATDTAYSETNAILNQNLTVAPVPGSESTTFQVSFTPITLPPFRDDSNTQDASPANFYPVSNYYLFVVPESHKSQFSITNAENILLQDNKDRTMYRYIPVNMQFLDAQKPQLYNYLGIDGPFGQRPLEDTNGDPVTTGVNYVVFLMARYDENYKRKLNTFDDFLSAPSSPFTLSFVLAQAKFTGSSSGSSDAVDSFTFTVSETAEHVEYRCILLPVSDNPSESGMTTVESQQELDQDIARLQALAKSLEPQIAANEKKIADSSSAMNDMESKNKDLLPGLNTRYAMFGKTNMGLPGDEAIARFNDVLKNDKQMSDKDKKTAATYFGYMKDKVSAQIELTKLNQQKKDTLDQIAASQQSRINFLFNLTLAAQVPAGSYIKAQPPSTPLAPPPGTWQVSIKDDATDNFGNLLIHYNKDLPADKQKAYLPVILSVSTADEQNQSKYTINWTGYTDSPKLIFK